ncbi:MAG: winged helix-turn-helix transcriptional regulator [Sphingomonadales bacterium]|nr:winged helix-turn-helix transcriptional regulator [Sphingomonadales bacterium]
MVQDAPIPALKALAHPLRWRILATLASGERNVGEIEQVTAIAQPGLSQQLGVLRKAGLVLTRKEAKLVFYSLSQEAMAVTVCVMRFVAVGAAMGIVAAWRVVVAAR